MFKSYLQTFRQTLALKLALAVALVVLATVGIMGTYAYVQERRSAIQRELMDIQTSSGQLAGRIDLSLATGKALAAHLACTRDGVDYLRGRARGGQPGQASCQAWLDLQLGQSPGISSIFILSPTGDCLASTKRKFIGHNYAFRPFHQEAMAGHLGLSDWSVGMLDRIPHVDSSAPVRFQGRIIGVLVTEFPVHDIEQAIRSEGHDGRTAGLINHAGIVLAHSNPAYQYHALAPLAPSVLQTIATTRQFMDREIPVGPFSADLAEGFRKVQQTARPLTIIYRLKGTWKMAAFTPLAEEGWVVSVAIPQDVILLPMRRAIGRTLLVGCATALAGILAALFMGRSLLASIHKLSDAMNRFGAGQTAARAPIENQDERGQLSQAFNRMADALQTHEARLVELQAQKLESLGTLVAGVAHNLNNVLAVAIGTASLREASTAGPADREAYRTIGRACIRGREVVRALIHFAQLDPAAKVPVELNGLVREACAVLAGNFRNRIRTVAALADEALWVHGNAGDISQVLTGLGNNAMDAMPQGGTLTYRTLRGADGWVELSVEDEGTGMTPVVLARAMEPFYTTKEVGHGTGLGLSTAYGVLKAHGGSIDIASHPGQGTTVKLRLPGIPAPLPEEDPAPARTPAVPALGSMRVFLVDDDEDVRILMPRMLKRAGVRQVEAFPGGKEMLEALEPGNLPDLVILDQNMPGLTGAETLERIRARYPVLPVLISSGQPDIETWECFRQPRVAVIAKPFTVDEIQGRLDAFC